MSEPVSTLAFLLAGYAFTPGAFARAGSGVSAEGKIARQEVGKLVRLAERSDALFGSKANAISQIWALVNECSVANWDGEGARPVDPQAAASAEELIRALPNGIPLPEFAAEPDGSISLDWIQSRNRLFSLSIGRGNRLPYAWLDGADKGHAVARFDGVQIPPRILEGISRIVNRSDVALRAA